MSTKCPNCKKKVEAESLGAHPHFPFCSERCRYADLDRWFEEDYTVPGDAPGEESA
ncbi:MAG: DNA gyrase inhibitor YacG [Planctomycetota bacterium]